MPLARTPGTPAAGVSGPASSTAPTARGGASRRGGSAALGMALQRALRRDPNALGRALGLGFGFGGIEDLALPPGRSQDVAEAEPATRATAAARTHIGAPIVRQGSGRAAPSATLPQRASRRGATRTHRGPRISQRAIARLAELSGADGIVGLDDSTLASAAGLVDRAVRRQASRSEEQVDRSAHVSPMMALPEAEFRAVLRSELADLTTIAAPAPTVHREILEAAARLDEASQVQRAPVGPKGPSAGGGKKDLEDFLRRAIRQIGVREEMERSRDLTPWD